MCVLSRRDYLAVPEDGGWVRRARNERSPPESSKYIAKGTRLCQFVLLFTCLYVCWTPWFLCIKLHLLLFFLLSWISYTPQPVLPGLIIVIRCKRTVLLNLVRPLSGIAGMLLPPKSLGQGECRVMHHPLSTKNTSGYTHSSYHNSLLIMKTWCPILLLDQEEMAQQKLLLRRGRVFDASVSWCIICCWLK